MGNSISCFDPVREHPPYSWPKDHPGRAAAIDEHKRKRRNQKVPASPPNPAPVEPVPQPLAADPKPADPVPVPATLVTDPLVETHENDFVLPGGEPDHPSTTPTTDPADPTPDQSAIDTSTSPQTDDLQHAVESTPETDLTLAVKTDQGTTAINATGTTAAEQATDTEPAADGAEEADKHLDAESAADEPADASDEALAATEPSAADVGAMLIASAGAADASTDDDKEEENEQGENQIEVEPVINVDPSEATQVVDEAESQVPIDIPAVVADVEVEEASQDLVKKEVEQMDTGNSVDGTEDMGDDEVIDKELGIMATPVPEGTNGDEILEEVDEEKPVNESIGLLPVAEEEGESKEVVVEVAGEDEEAKGIGAVAGSEDVPSIDTRRAIFDTAEDRLPEVKELRRDVLDPVTKENITLEEYRKRQMEQAQGVVRERVEKFEEIDEERSKEIAEHRAIEAARTEAIVKAQWKFKNKGQEAMTEAETALLESSGNLESSTGASDQVLESAVTEATETVTETPATDSAIALNGSESAKTGEVGGAMNLLAGLLPPQGAEEETEDIPERPRNRLYDAQDGEATAA